MTLRRLFIASLLTAIVANVGVPQAKADTNDVAALPGFVAARNGMPMPTGDHVIPPGGVIGFCLKNLGQCGTVVQQPVVVELTPDRQRELDEVQALVNVRVRPRENPQHAWEYASSGYGDCNTYAIEKRRELLARGWPQTALLLASAVTETGEGHLVLIARTSGGDLVLDNRLVPVVDWSRLPYRWVSRQSEQRLTIWLSILQRPLYTSDVGTGKVGS